MSLREKLEKVKANNALQMLASLGGWDIDTLIGCAVELVDKIEDLDERLNCLEHGCKCQGIYPRSPKGPRMPSP
jgi:hypothetical protein